MAKFQKRREPNELPVNQDDPENADELDRLNAKLERHNREAALLAAAMRGKPKKP